MEYSSFILCSMVLILQKNVYSMAPETESCTEVLGELFEPLKLSVIPSERDIAVGEEFSIVCLSKHSDSRAFFKIHSPDNSKVSTLLGKNKTIIGDGSYSTGYMATHSHQVPGMYYIQCISAWEFKDSTVYNKTLFHFHSPVEQIRIVQKNVFGTSSITVSSVLTTSTTTPFTISSTAIYYDASVSISSTMLLSSTLSSFARQPSSTNNFDTPLCITPTHQTLTRITSSLMITSLQSSVPSNSLVALVESVMSEESTMLHYYIIIGVLSGVSSLSVIMNILLLLHYYKSYHQRKLNHISKDFSEKQHNIADSYCNSMFDNNNDNINSIKNNNNNHDNINADDNNTDLYTDHVSL